MHYESHKYPSLFSSLRGMQKYVGVGIAAMCLTAAAYFLSARASSSKLPDGSRLPEGWKFENNVIYTSLDSASLDSVAGLWKCGGVTDIQNCEQLPKDYKLEFRGVYQAVLDANGNAVGYLRHKDPVIDRLSTTSNPHVIESLQGDLGGRSHLREFVPLEKRF